ncbi:hypothetical protein CRG98_007670 [Punica granatum]|uniref:Uncharacterized protein n=1 Tax=Punica granatum TaxID=22663 RepID=A0A2I0KTZ0_PUNGR|nr:hypothetical protein CRG98_007670 [Punica granatum]
MPISDFAPALGVGEAAAALMPAPFPSSDLETLATLHCLRILSRPLLLSCHSPELRLPIAVRTCASLSIGGALGGGFD